jgi:hypothetical protein
METPNQKSVTTVEVKPAITNPRLSHQEPKMAQPTMTKYTLHRLSPKIFLWCKYTTWARRIWKAWLISSETAFAGYHLWRRWSSPQTKAGPDYIYEKFESGDTEKDIALGWFYDQKILKVHCIISCNHVLTPSVDANVALLKAKRVCAFRLVRNRRPPKLIWLG